jgi:fluoroquinolone resistance protein
MNKFYIENETFEKINCTEIVLIKGDYENCTFINCNFPNIDLSNINFIECTFKGCDLSVAKLIKTAFRDVKFKDCKMLGLHFENCNEFLFSVYFENCILNLSSFYKRSLKKTKFVNTRLHEVDFGEADLTASVFDNCDLMRAIFDHTNLEKTDLRTSYNYSIDPEMNRIKKAKFAIAGIAGLLHKYDIIIE